MKIITITFALASLMAAATAFASPSGTTPCWLVQEDLQGRVYSSVALRAWTGAADEDGQQKILDEMVYFNNGSKTRFVYAKVYQLSGAPYKGYQALIRVTKVRKTNVAFARNQSATLRDVLVSAADLDEQFNYVLDCGFHSKNRE